MSPRLCPTLPGALGTFNRDCRLKAPVFPGMVAHVPGHKYSCSWVQSCKNVVSFFTKVTKVTAGPPKGGEPHPVLPLFAPFGDGRKLLAIVRQNILIPKFILIFGIVIPKFYMIFGIRGKKG